MAPAVPPEPLEIFTAQSPWPLVRPVDHDEIGNPDPRGSFGSTNMTRVTHGVLRDILHLAAARAMVGAKSNLITLAYLLRPSETQPCSCFVGVGCVGFLHGVQQSTINMEALKYLYHDMLRLEFGWERVGSPRDHWTSNWENVPILVPQPFLYLVL